MEHFLVAVVSGAVVALLEVVIHRLADRWAPGRTA